MTSATTKRKPGTSAEPAIMIAQKGPAEPATLIVDGRGMIRACNSSCEKLLGYRRRELTWRHISMVLPTLAEVGLMENGEPNPRLRFLCRIGRRFEVVPRDQGQFAGDIFLNRLGGRDRLSLIIRPAADGGD